MRIVIVSILIIWTSIFLGDYVKAQIKENGKLSIEQQSKLMVDNSVCVHRNIFTKSQRLSFYPFNKTSRISIISFLNSDKIPVEKGKLDGKLINERKDLSASEIDNLTDLLYNYGFKSRKYGYVLNHMSCYNPHNGILFLDKNNKVLAYIEICFDCLRQRTSSDRIKTGDECSEKFLLLRKFFSSLGVKTGTRS